MKKIIIAGILALVSLSSAHAATVVKKQKYNFEGVITQTNQLDGSFDIRLRDGKTITVLNPFIVGSFLGINADMTRIATSVQSVSAISFFDPRGADAIPTLTEVNPGSAAIGDRIKISGGPFLKSGNDIGVRGPINGIMKGVLPIDNQTLAFVVPSKICTAYQKTKCLGYTKPVAGEYEISVLNANGLSNATKINLKDLPALSLITDKLPQGNQGTRYEMQLAGTGGTDSYSWKIVGGLLPDGLRLVTPVCFAAPCRANATIVGTPKTPGDYTFSVKLTSGEEIVSREFTIRVIQSINTNYYSGTGAQ